MRTLYRSGWGVPLILATLLAGWASPVPAAEPDSLAEEESSQKKARRIRIDGTTITIDGDDLHMQVDEALRAAEEELERVEEELERIGDGKTRRWDVVRFGEDVFIAEDEFVSGDAVSIFGNVMVEGHVTGDVVAVFGNVSLGDGAVVHGEAVSVFGRVVEAPGAHVRGQTVSVGFGQMGGRFLGEACPMMMPRVWIMIGSLIGMGVLLLLALLVLVVFRQGTLRMSDALRRDLLKSWLFGLLTEVILVVVSVILAVTIVGIPVVILIACLALLAYLWAFAGVSLRVGQAVLGGGEGRSEAGMLLLGGLAILAVPVLARILGAVGLLVPAMGIWFVGGLISWFAVTAGLGAVVTTRFGTRDTGKPVAEVSPPPQAAPEAPQV